MFEAPSRRAWLCGAAAAVLVATRTAAADHAAVLTGPPPTLPGPKRTLAVGQIDALGPYANNSATNVGGAIAAMLTTALQESGQVLVLERDALAGVVTEQELARSGVSSGNAAPQPGRVLPAQYIVTGSVTEFTAASAGSGGGFSIGGSTALNLGGSKGVVGLDLRIVDTRTSEVISAFKVRHKLTATNVGLSTHWSGVPIATNGFFNTPLGEATRAALNDAVNKILTTLGAVPWRGQVVEVEGTQVYINAGSQAGINAGDRLTIQRAGKTFTDPSTGQVLSQRYDDLGSLTITNVEAKLSSGMLPADAPVPSRGDLVILQR